MSNRLQIYDPALDEWSFGSAVPGFLGGLAFAHFIILLLLGPGAYSLDARLFGRRVTVLTSPR